jgi:hypothetical protein
MSTLIGVVSELMLTIPSEKVRVVSERLERQKGELVKYLEPLQEELLALKQQVGNDELVNLCLKEWRLERDVQRNRGGAEEALKQCQERLSCWKEAVVKPVRKAVQWLLGHVVRASSLVETVNSWLRPFLWRRKGYLPYGVSQEGNGRGIYNLLRFCWNTHRFFRGKRQGKTPLQLAGIEVSTDDWLQLLGFAPKSEKVSTNF